MYVVPIQYQYITLVHIRIILAQLSLYLYIFYYIQIEVLYTKLLFHIKINYLKKRLKKNLTQKYLAIYISNFFFLSLQSMLRFWVYSRAQTKGFFFLSYFTLRALTISPTREYSPTHTKKRIFFYKTSKAYCFVLSNIALHKINIYKTKIKLKIFF